MRFISTYIIIIIIITIIIIIIIIIMKYIIYRNISKKLLQPRALSRNWKLKNGDKTANSLCTYN